MKYHHHPLIFSLGKNSLNDNLAPREEKGGGGGVELAYANLALTKYAKKKKNHTQKL